LLPVKPLVQKEKVVVKSALNAARRIVPHAVKMESAATKKELVVQKVENALPKDKNVVLIQKSAVNKITLRVVKRKGDHTIAFSFDEILGNYP
jgi:predicted CoA-binding protein